MRGIKFFNRKFSGRVSRATATLCLLLFVAVCGLTGISAAGVGAGADVDAYLPQEEGTSAAAPVDDLSTVAASGAGLSKKFLPGLNTSNVSNFLANQQGTTYTNNPAKMFYLDYDGSLSGIVTKSIAGVGSTYGASPTSYTAESLWGTRTVSEKKVADNSSSGEDWSTCGNGGWGYAYWTTVEFSPDMMDALINGGISGLNFYFRTNTAEGTNWVGTVNERKDFLLAGYMWTESMSEVYTGSGTSQTAVSAINVTTDADTGGGQRFVDYFSARNGEVWTNPGTSPSQIGIPDSYPNGWNMNSVNQHNTLNIKAPGSNEKAKYLTLAIRMRASDKCNNGIQNPLDLRWTQNANETDNTAPSATAAYSDENGAITTTAKWSKSKKLEINLSDSGRGLSWDTKLNFSVIDNGGTATNEAYPLSGFMSRSTVFGTSATATITRNAADSPKYASISAVKIVIDTPEFPTKKVSFISADIVDLCNNKFTFTPTGITDSAGNGRFTFERCDNVAPAAPTVTVVGAQELTAGSNSSYVVSTTGKITLQFNNYDYETGYSYAGENNSNKIRFLLRAKGAPEENLFANGTEVGPGTGDLQVSVSPGIYFIYLGATDGVNTTLAQSPAGLSGGCVQKICVETADINENIAVLTATAPTLVSGASWATGDGASKWTFDVAFGYLPYAKVQIKAELIDNGTSATSTQVWATLEHGGSSNFQKVFNTNSNLTINSIYLYIEELDYSVAISQAIYDVKIDTSTPELSANAQQPFNFNQWLNGAALISGQANVSVNVREFFSQAYGGTAQFFYKAASYAHDTLLPAAPDFSASTWIEISTNDATSAMLGILLGNTYIADLCFKTVLPNGKQAEITTYNDGTADRYFRVLYDNVAPEYTFELFQRRTDGSESQYAPDSAVNNGWSSLSVVAKLTVTNFSAIGRQSAVTASIKTESSWYTPEASDTRVSLTGAGTEHIEILFKSIDAAAQFKIVANVDSLNVTDASIKVDLLAPDFAIVGRDLADLGDRVWNDTWTTANRVKIFVVSKNSIASGMTFKCRMSTTAFSTNAGDDFAALWNSTDYVDVIDDQSVFQTSEDGIYYVHMIAKSGAGLFSENKFLNKDDFNSSTSITTPSGRGVYKLKKDSKPVVLQASMPTEQINAYTGPNWTWTLNNAVLTSTENASTSPYIFEIGFGNTSADIAEWHTATYDVTAQTLSATISDVCTRGVKKLFIKAYDQAGNTPNFTEGPQIVLGNKKVTLNLGAASSKYAPSAKVNGVDAVIGNTGGRALEVKESDEVELTFGVSNVDYYKLTSFGYPTGGNFADDQIVKTENSIKFRLTYVTQEESVAGYAFTPVIKTIVKFDGFTWTYQKGEAFNQVGFNATYENNLTLDSAIKSTISVTYYKQSEGVNGTAYSTPPARDNYIFVLNLPADNADYVGSYQGTLIWTDSDKAEVSMIETMYFRPFIDSGGAFSGAFDYATIFSNPDYLARFIKVTLHSVAESGIVTDIDITPTTAMFANTTINGTGFVSAFMRDSGTYTIAFNYQNGSYTAAGGATPYKIEQTINVSVEALPLTANVGAVGHNSKLSKVYDGTADIPAAILNGEAPLFAYLLFETSIKAIDGTPITIPSKIVNAGTWQNHWKFTQADVYDGYSYVNQVVFNSANYSFLGGRITIPSEIKPKDLTLSISSAVSREYDGSVLLGSFVFTDHISVAGAIAGESVSIEYIGGEYSSKNAGERFITLSNVTIKRGLLVDRNYQLAQNHGNGIKASQVGGAYQLTVAATILKRKINNITSDNVSLTKTFDGLGVTGVRFTFDGLLATDNVDANANGLPDILETFVEINGGVFASAVVKNVGTYLLTFGGSSAGALPDTVGSDYELVLKNSLPYSFNYVIRQLVIDAVMGVNSKEFDTKAPIGSYTVEGANVTKNEGSEVYNFALQVNGVNYNALPAGYKIALDFVTSWSLVGVAPYNASYVLTAPDAASMNDIAVNFIGASSGYEIKHRRVVIDIATDVLVYDGVRKEQVQLNQIGSVKVKDIDNNVLISDHAVNASATEGALADLLFKSLYANLDIFQVSLRNDSGVALNVGTYYWANKDNAESVRKAQFEIYVTKQGATIQPAKYFISTGIQNYDLTYGMFYKSGNPFPEQINYTLMNENADSVIDLLPGVDGAQIPVKVIATFERPDGQTKGLYGNVGTYKIKITDNLRSANFTFVNLAADGYLISNYKDVNASSSPVYEQLTIKPYDVSIRLADESGEYGEFKYSDFSPYADLNAMTMAQLNRSKIKFYNYQNVNVTLLVDGINKFAAGCKINLKKGAATAADNAKGVLDAGDYTFAADGWAANSLGPNYNITNHTAVSATLRIAQYLLTVRPAGVAAKTYDGTAFGTAPEIVVRDRDGVMDFSVALHNGVMNFKVVRATSEGQPIGVGMIDAGTYPVKVVFADNLNGELRANYNVQFSEGSMVIVPKPITLSFAFKGGATALVGRYAYGTAIGGRPFDANDTTFFNAVALGVVAGETLNTFNSADIAIASTKLADGTGYTFTLSYKNLTQLNFDNPNYIFSDGEAALRQVVMLKVNKTLKVDVTQYYGENYTTGTVANAVSDANYGALADVLAKAVRTDATGAIPFGLAAGYVNTLSVNVGAHQNSVLVFNAANLIENQYYSVASVDVILTVKGVEVRIEAVASMTYGAADFTALTIKYYNNTTNTLINYNFGAVADKTGISALDAGSHNFNETNGKVLFTGFAAPNGNYIKATDGTRNTLSVTVSPKNVAITVTGGNSKAYDGVADTQNADGTVSLTGILYNDITAEIINGDTVNPVFTRAPGSFAGAYAMQVAASGADNGNYVFTLASGTVYNVTKANIAGLLDLGATYTGEYFKTTAEVILTAFIASITGNKATNGLSDAMILEIKNHADVYLHVGGAAQKLARDAKLSVPELPYVITLGVSGSANIEDTDSASNQVSLIITPYVVTDNVYVNQAVYNTVYGATYGDIFSKVVLSVVGSTDSAVASEIKSAVGYEASGAGPNLGYIKDSIVGTTGIPYAGTWWVRAYGKSANFNFGNKLKVTEEQYLLKAVIAKRDLSISVADVVGGKVTKTYNGSPCTLDVSFFVGSEELKDYVFYNTVYKLGSTVVDSAVNVGEYTVEINLNATNYTVVSGTNVFTLTIVPKALNASTHIMEFEAVSSIYDGAEKQAVVKFRDKSTNAYDTVNATIEYTLAGVSSTIRGVGVYGVIVKVNDANYIYDTAVGVNANAVFNTTPVVYTVEKSSDISSFIDKLCVSFANANSVYSKDGVKVEYTFNNDIAFKHGFGFVLTVRDVVADGAGSYMLYDAGTYTAILTVSSSNFSVTYQIRQDYVVETLKVGVTMEFDSREDYCYNGRAHSVQTKAIDINGNALDVFLKYEIETAPGVYKTVDYAIDAGNYRVTANISSKNYSADTTSGANVKTFTLNPASVTFEFIFGADDTETGVDGYSYAYKRNTPRAPKFSIDYNGKAIEPEMSIVYAYKNGGAVGPVYDDDGKLVEGVIYTGEYTATVSCLDRNYDCGTHTVNITVRKAKFTDYDYTFADMSFTYTGEFYDNYVEIIFNDPLLNDAINKWQVKNAADGKPIVYFDNYYYYKVNEDEAHKNGYVSYENLTTENDPYNLLSHLDGNLNNPAGLQWGDPGYFNDEMAIDVGVYRIKCVMAAQGEVVMGIGENERPVTYTLDFDEEVIWCTLTIKPAKFEVNIIRRDDKIMVGTQPIPGAMYSFNGGEFQESNEFKVADIVKTKDYFVTVKLSGQAAINYNVTEKTLLVAREVQPITIEMICVLVGGFIGVAGLIIGIILLKKKFYTKSRKERRADKKAAKKAKKQAKKQRKIDKKNKRRGILPEEVAIASEETAETDEELPPESEEQGDGETD